jgi:transcriptional regulator of acetoin/glycerol metabolism
MLRLIADVLEAAGSAHTPRVLARGLAQALTRHLPVRRVEVGTPEPIAVVERDGDAWRPAAPARDPRAKAIADGLAIAVDGYLPPAVTAPEMRAVLDRALAMALRHTTVVDRVAGASRRAHAESRELRADLARVEPAGEVVARSPAMRETLARARLVAIHPTTVLVTGESGSGKEVLAREIHRRSPRAHRALMQLDCGTLPEHLVESELFGHERGAFTGAERQHRGLFERAHRGTLFLDELGPLHKPSSCACSRSAGSGASAAARRSTSTCA